MKYTNVFIIALMCLFHASCGQNQANQQDKFKREHNGISESQFKEIAASKVPMTQVRHIKQARNGDILIAATWSGVFRYDGKSFTKISSSIPGFHRFWDVLEDRRGNMWFASNDSGVYCYNGRSFQHFTIREGLVNNSVFSIYEDKAGVIWFGTGGGVSRYDGSSFRNFTTEEGLSDDALTMIMEDKSGKLWFGTRGEPCFYDGKTFTVLKNNDGKPFKNVWSIIEDNKGSIWFGDNDGLWRYDGSTVTKVSQRGAYAIIQDKNGNIWTTGGLSSPVGPVWALSRYDAKSLYNKMPTVTDIKTGGPGSFLALLEANDGSIWFGSAGGVYRYDGKTIMDFKSSINSDTPNVSTSRWVDTKYEYSDSIGKHLIIQNSFPRGDSYIDPGGKRYFKVTLWTRVINETDSPLELKIDFPVDLYKVAGWLGKYYKVLVPPDTMTIDKEPLYNYGLTDNSILEQPTYLRRTVNPKESTGFFVVILIADGGGGALRTGLSIKGRNLYYRISRHYKGALVDEREINCGSINITL